MNHVKMTLVLLVCVSSISWADEKDENTIIGEWILDPIRFDVRAMSFSATEGSEDAYYISGMEFIDTEFVRLTYSNGNVVGGLYEVKALGEYEFRNAAFNHYVYELTVLTVKQLRLTFMLSQRDDDRFRIVTTQSIYCEILYPGFLEYTDSKYTGVFEFRKADGEAVFLESVFPEPVSER